jgi:hypothetical protein
LSTVVHFFVNIYDANLIKEIANDKVGIATEVE